MKLQNLIKDKVLKENKTTGLGTFAPTLGDVAQKKKDRAPSVFVPSKRDPEAVPAPAINIWKQPVYVPEKQGYQRPGAEDFLKYKSRGLG